MCRVWSSVGAETSPVITPSVKDEQFSFLPVVTGAQSVPLMGAPWCAETIPVPALPATKPGNAS